MTTETITSLTATVTETLGLDDAAAVEAAIRRHRTERYEEHTEGSEALETLLRAVWDDVTDGAEWPW